MDVCLIGDDRRDVCPIKDDRREAPAAETTAEGVRLVRCRQKPPEQQKHRTTKHVSQQKSARGRCPGRPSRRRMRRPAAAAAHGAPAASETLPYFSG